MEESLTDAVWFLLCHHASRRDISLALADQYGRPLGTPIPLDTIDDHIAKAWALYHDRRKEERDRAKELQLERLYATLRTMRGATHFRAAIETEKLIAKIEGNEAPKQIRLGGPGASPTGGPIPIAQVQNAPTSDELRRELAKTLARANEAAAAAPAAGPQPIAPGDAPPDDDQ